MNKSGKFISSRFRRGWSQKGYTLTEVVMAAAIMGMAMGGVYMFLRFVFVAFDKGQSDMLANEVAEVSMSEMTRMIRQATSITFPAPSFAPTALPTPAPGPHYQEICFKVPSLTIPQDSAYDDQIIYRLVKVSSGRYLLYQYIDPSPVTATPIPITNQMDQFRKLWTTNPYNAINSTQTDILNAYNNPNVSFDDITFLYDPPTTGSPLVGIALSVSVKGFGGIKHHAFLQTAVVPLHLK